MIMKKKIGKIFVIIVISAIAFSVIVSLSFGF